MPLPRFPMCGQRGVVWSLATLLRCAFLSVVWVGSSQAFDLSAGSTTAAPSETVTLLVTIDDIATNPPGNLLAVDLNISYDATALSLATPRVGSFFPADGSTNSAFNDVGPGNLLVSISNTGGVALVEGGELLELDFTVAPGAIDGAKAIDITFGEVNEIPADNLVDGALTVASPVADTVYPSNVQMIIRVCQVVGC